MAKLSLPEIREALQSLHHWQIGENAISKLFTLPTFMDAIGFVNAVAELAKGEDHRPDILINDRRVTLTLWTPSEGGVTVKDLELARKIEEILAVKPSQTA